MDTTRDDFLTQCSNFEVTFQTVLLRAAGLYEVTTHFNVPEELKSRVEEVIASITDSGTITKKQRAVLIELAEIKVDEFSSAYAHVVEAKGGSHKGFMALEKEILVQFIMHLFLEHFIRHHSGQRKADYEYLFADQQNAVTAD